MVPSDSEDTEVVMHRPTTEAVLQSFPVVTITPPWPAPQYTLACPPATPQSTCERLASSRAAIEAGCYEPERDTAEVITALFQGCEGCLYVDVGCNIGAFATQAVSLGASVDCYEPTPFYIDAIRESLTRASSVGRLLGT